MLSSSGVITLIMLSSMMKALHCDELQMSETLFSTQHRNVNQSPILSGFVYVNGIVLKIKRRLNLPSACKSVSFVNVPLNTTSPLMKGNTFDLILEDLYNGRYGWTNGVDYLSYFPSSDDSSPYGTWLLGNKPGIDSGYAYLKPSHDTLVPIDVRQSDWHWLEGKDWEKRPAVKVICNDYPHDQDLKEKEYISSHFYQVEYFVGSTIHSGYYTPAHPEISSQSTLLSSLKKSEQKMLLSLNAPSLWSDTKLDKINTGTGGKFRVLCNVGGATMIVDGSGKSVIGHLIQDEVRGSGSGWSLIFRKVQGALSDEIKSESNSQIEIIVEISSKGSMNGFSLRPLSIEEESDYMMPMKRSLETSKKGDYLWIWYSVLPVEMTQYISSNSADINFDGSTLLGLESRVTSSSKLIEKSVEEETEILLECVARSDSKIIFKYYFADRRDAMRQSVLSKETHYFTYTKKLNSQSDNEGKENSNGIMFDQMNSEIKTNAIFFIGADVIGFIRNYLDYKENWNGLSSCFLYHAAVTLPRPLVYAAEILCVLSGAKAVTMIQFSTPSDFQWKFPLVSELSHSIVRTKLLLGDDFDVEFRTFTYIKDESLVFYRRNRAYVVDSLVPFNISQALHPLPFPQKDNLDADHKLQIYNAWWNGYVLGYPERFVNSYCETFHNGLDIDSKRIEIMKAQSDAKLYMVENNQSVALIGTGLEPSITDLAWKTITSNL